MQVWQIIFFLSCFIIFYNYFGYVLVIYFVRLFDRPKKSSVLKDDYFPPVSFIVAAFNEEDCIEQKVLDSLAQDYPRNRIEFIFITDGSTDRTVSILENYPDIKMLHSPERKGKSAALNRAVQAARHEILIFSDANTSLNKDATKNIVRHYRFPDTGGVSGEKKIFSPSGASDEVGTGEGLYWKYESLLKKIDSDFYSVVGAAGELFSVRKELYETLPHNVILDDFLVSLKTTQKGFRVIYEPEAYAIELPSFSLQDEQKRKVRIAAGGFQAMIMLKSLLHFWKTPRLSFLYISHRVLRWTLSPLCLMLAFMSNAVLFFGTGTILFKTTFIIQIIFYSMAFISATVPSAKGLKLFKIPYYFTFMNISVFLGFFRFLRGSQSAVWEKAKRVQGVF